MGPLTIQLCICPQHSLPPVKFQFIHFNIDYMKESKNISFSVRVHVYICVPVCTCVFVYMYVHMCACMNACVCVHASMHVGTWCAPWHESQRTTCGVYAHLPFSLGQSLICFPSVLFSRLVSPWGSVSSRFSSPHLSRNEQIPREFRRAERRTSDTQMSVLPVEPASPPKWVSSLSVD